MTRTVRSFIAVELPTEAKEALSLVTMHLRHAKVKAIRTTDPDVLHLTLKFLGDVTPEQLARVAAGARTVSQSFEPFSIKLGGVGIFPNRRSPRVFWVGIRGALNSLRDLQNGIEQSMSELGFPTEKQAFTPHLTIARLRGDSPPKELRRATAALCDAPPISGIPIAVESVSLIHSILTPRGARYSRLTIFPLGTRTPYF